MNESNHTDTSGKFQNSPASDSYRDGGVRGIIPTHYQQLPIKDKLLRLPMQPFRFAPVGHHVHK